MECITACPDTALPNTSQDVVTVLRTAINYVTTSGTEEIARRLGVEDRARARMVAAIDKGKTAVQGHHQQQINALAELSDKTKAEFTGIIEKLPVAYSMFRRFSEP